MLYGLYALLLTWLGAAVFAILATLFVALSLKTGDKHRWGRRASLSIGGVCLFMLPTFLLDSFDSETKEALDERALLVVLAVGAALGAGVFAIGRGGRHPAETREPDACR
jgi:hypothetical protein